MSLNISSNMNGEDLCSRKLGGAERLWYNTLLNGLALENRFKSDKSSPVQHEDESVEWHGDYYRVHKIDDNTYAIGEQNDQCNHSYVILGGDKAILLDAGVKGGVHDLAQKIAEKRGMKLDLMFSHLHYDHLGKFDTAEAIMPALPHIKAKANSDGLIRKNTIDKLEHLGIVEGIEPPDIQVTQWVEIGEEIDLGGRKLRMIYAPGHCWNHVVLWDKENNQIFASDLMGTFPIYAMVPTSSVGDLEWTVQNLLQITNEQTQIFNTHRSAHPGLPVQGKTELVALQGLLNRAIKGDTPEHKFHNGPFKRYESDTPGVSLVTPWLFKFNDRILPHLPSGIPD